MRQDLRDKIISACTKRILAKGEAVGVFFTRSSQIKIMIRSFLWKLQGGG